MSVKPRIYIGGKIHKNDWRHRLVPSLQGASLGTPIDCPSFIYSGPFVVACDHGCAHRPSSHGVRFTCCTENFGAPLHWVVPSLCCHWISQSDLIFAWFDDPTAFGTLVELGWAQMLGKQVYLGFSSAGLAKDMWFATHGPNTASGTHRSPWEAFNTALVMYDGRRCA